MRSRLGRNQLQPLVQRRMNIWVYVRSLFGRVVSSASACVLLHVVDVPGADLWVSLAFVPAYLPISLPLRLPTHAYVRVYFHAFVHP